MFHMFKKVYCQYHSHSVLLIKHAVDGCGIVELTVDSVFDNSESIHTFFELLKSFQFKTDIIVVVPKVYYTELYAYLLMELFGKDPNLIYRVLEAQRKKLLFDNEDYQIIPIDDLRGLINYWINNYQPVYYTDDRFLVTVDEMPFELQVIGYDLGQITKEQMAPTLKQLVRHTIVNELQIFVTESRYLLNRESLYLMFGVEMGTTDDVVECIVNTPLIKMMYIDHQFDIELYHNEYKKAFAAFYRDEEYRDQQFVDLIGKYMEDNFTEFDFHDTEFIADLDAKYKSINMFIIASGKKGLEAKSV